VAANWAERRQKELSVMSVDAANLAQTVTAVRPIVPVCSLSRSVTIDL
jgi:hypothetical protein